MFAILLDKEAADFFIFAMTSTLDNYKRKKRKKVHLPNLWKQPLSISSFSSKRKRRIVAWMFQRLLTVSQFVFTFQDPVLFPDL
jgi:hypothetical protein